MDDDKKDKKYTRPALTKNIFDEEMKKMLEEHKDDEDGDDEDGDVNFIKKDAAWLEYLVAQKRKNEVVVEEDPKKRKKPSGVRPEGNQQRNLDRETGGLEAGELNISKEEAADIWDKRPEEIEKMIEAGQDLNNAAKSSRDQAFIHRKKQEKKRKSPIADAAIGGGFVSNLNKARKARLDRGDAFSGNDRGGSGGFSGAGSGGSGITF